MKKTNRKTISYMSILLCGISIILLILKSILAPKEAWLSLLLSALQEFSLGIAAIFIIVLIKNSYYLKIRFDGIISIFIFLGGLAIAATNFPFATMSAGLLEITRPDLIWVYIIYVLSIGFFEELVFRGVVFPEILHRTKVSRLNLFLSIILTSGIFGLVHLLNIFEGASVGSSLLQVCYTFLVGCMCNVVMLATGSLFWPVILHAAFDFGGLLTSAGIAAGSPWNTTGAVIMAVVSVIVGLLYVLYFIKDRYIVLKSYNRFS